MFPEELTRVATKLVALCQSGKEAEALNTLYDDQCVSWEAASMEGGEREFRGLDAIRAKHEYWFANNEVHSSSAEGPFLFGDDTFSVIFDMDVTMKPANQRIQMREVGVYTVEDGKIVREAFHSPIMG